ncbi:MAG: cytochrome c [Solirubrobacterales bacterium]|nr:cytochrome c [Solirubrobacterales bacterium]
MIGIYAFAIFWIALAVGILLFSLLKDRSPRTGPTRPATRKRMLIGFGVVYVAIGLVVPAFSIADSQNADVVRGEGIKLTANEKKGQALFGQLCGSCHQLASANANGRVGPSLDMQLMPQPAADAAAAAKNYKGRSDYVYTVIINGLQRGNGNMPALVTQGQQAKDIAAFVAATAGYANP